ncbi:MAG: hypothetical protein R8L58_08180 [Mariprofundaceae bacterium]
MKKTILLISGLLLAGISQTALASDDARKMHGHHMHGEMHGDMQNPCAMDGHEHMHGDMAGHHQDARMGDKKGVFMATKEVDGYAVTFHVMQAPEGMKKGGSHHLMVKVEKDGKIVSDLVANSKAAHPNGKSESKMLMQMGDWYMAAYDLDHPGQHELMVLFKTSDGAKHFAGVHYPEPKAE